MTPEAFRLLHELGSGRPISLGSCAARHGSSVEDLRRRIDEIRVAGAPVEQASADAFRLRWPIDFLDAAAIRGIVGPGADAVEVHDQLDSTNRFLADHFSHRKAVLAEFQHAGRGRRGRAWQSPPGCGIWLSFGYRFDCGLARLSALSLAVGVAISEALPAAVGLKWPNDLLAEGGKLGGVLIEARGGATGGCEVAIGVGVNVRLPASSGGSGPGAQRDPPWTDLFRQASETVDRSRLAGQLIAALNTACAIFDRDGFEAFAERWRARDVLAGREVVVHRAGEPQVQGLAEGVDEQGRLRVGAGPARRLFDSGEVSVRVC